MTYYIFRHGATYENKVGIDYTAESVFTSPILPDAKIEIKKLSDYLEGVPTDLNVSSPFLRCRQTVEIIEKATDKKFIFDNRIGEYVFQKGETFDQLRDRIKNFFDEISQRDLQNIAICTHGGIIAGLKSFILKGEFELSNLHDFPRPGVLWEIKAGTVEEKDFNT